MVESDPAGDRHMLPTAADLPGRRILVVANQTATGSALVGELHEQADRGPVRVHLVVPALNSRLRHWLSDVDDALSNARQTAEEAVAVLAAAGMVATAEVGDSVPLLAIEDALAEFAADEILISTLAPERSHWLEQGLVEQAKARFPIPVTHVVAEEGGVHRPTRRPSARPPLAGQRGRRRQGRAVTM